MVVLIGISLINVLLVNICGYLLLLEPKLFSSQLGMYRRKKPRYLGLVCYNSDESFSRTYNSAAELI